MNTEEPDELTREYQRASATDAGMPGRATRDAILAEARKAALRRQPAANDSRYLLRAVAGVAVLGVAVLLWRQQDPRMPQAQPEYPAAKAESASAEAPAETADERSLQALRTAPAMRSEAVGQAAADSASVAVSRSVPADGNAILRRAFAPAQQDAITPPAAAWVIRDANGVVLRSGVAASEAELAAIAIDAQRDFRGQQVGRWTPLPATTPAGQSILVHVAELQ